MCVRSFRKVPFLQLNFIVFDLHIICTKLANNRRWINGWHRYSILHLPATCTYVDSRRVWFVRSFPQLALTMHTQEMDQRITVSWTQVLQRWRLFTLSEYCIIEPCLKWGCIEFKYYADGIHSGITPPG